MEIVKVNLLAVLLLCTFICFWIGLELRMERVKRDFHSYMDPSFYTGPSVDLSPKTFRVLLTVSEVQGDSMHFHNQSHAVTLGNNMTLNFSIIRTSNGDFPINLNELIEDDIFWSESLEAFAQEVFDEEHARVWGEQAQGARIVLLEPGCGRLTNRLATFADGTKACVRYGINADQVQGETLSYYLARLLGISNLPPLALSKLNPFTEQWGAVTESIETLQWATNAVVSLTEWVPNLTGVFIPAPFRKAGRGLYPIRESLKNTTVSELIELMQWTDLIIFDYLTANFDRLVSNLFSLQWDARMMERATSNLLKSTKGDLIFIDNEAGLVHGYRVLNMWEKYHKTLLGSVCIFRRKTVQRITELKRIRNAGLRLLELYRASEPLALELGFLSEEHAETLQNRVNQLYKHMQQCKLRHG